MLAQHSYEAIISRRTFNKSQSINRVSVCLCVHMKLFVPTMTVH